MPRPVVVLLSLMLLLVAAAGIVAAYPVILLRPLLQVQLAATGFRLTNIEALEAGLQQASAARLSAESSSIGISIENAQVSYSLGQLFGGRVQSIEIDSFDLELKGAAENGRIDSSASMPPTELFTTLAALPLDSIHIEQTRVHSQAGELLGRADFQTSPLNLSFTGQMLATQVLDLQIATEALAENRIWVLTSISQDGDELLNGENEVLLADDGLIVDGTLRVDANNLLQGLLDQEEQEIGWSVLNDKVQLNYRLNLNTETSPVRVESLTSTIGSTSPNLQLQVGIDNSQLIAQVDMPLTVNMAPNTVNDMFNIALSDSAHNISWSRGNDQLHLETRLSNMRANCETWNRCNATGQFQALSPAWQFAGGGGAGARMEGQLSVEQLPNFIELRGENVALTVDTAQYSDWNGSGTFNLEEILLILGEVDRGRIKLRSEQLDLGSDEFSLTSPRIASTVNFSADNLAGSIDFALGTGTSLEQPLVNASFNHSLESMNGRANITLNEVELTDSNPLSSMIDQQWLNMDIVAGTIDGNGEINWRQIDGGIQVTGPASLALNALSGHVEDTLLVGVNTVARGEFRDWTEIVSEPNLKASIDVVDIGLPTRNVQWQYSFNTANREMRIRELNSELFGGKVEIADFRLNPDNLNQDLTVVLSRLDLESIVELAGYPQLFVDGLISGYIPLTLEDGRILVNDGLVSALRPGGNIRYTPASNTGAINQSVRLVNDALSNYQYEILNTRVFYDANGELRLEVQLQGLNPDMNGGQPINLNVNVTDNIPSLLRSLKAGQEISERLEQRLQNR